jgi:cell shape-determining protein MreD
MDDTSRARAVDGRGAVTLLRVVAALGCLETVVQGLLAGMLLNGDVDSIDPHGVNAYVFELLVFLQVVAAVLLWRRNRRLTRPPVATTGILLATLAQSVLGVECAAETALALWAFTLRVTSPPDRGGRAAH